MAAETRKDVEELTLEEASLEVAARLPEMRDVGFHAEVCAVVRFRKRGLICYKGIGFTDCKGRGWVPRTDLVALSVALGRLPEPCHIILIPRSEAFGPPIVHVCRGDDHYPGGVDGDSPQDDHELTILAAFRAAAAALRAQEANDDQWR